MLLTSFVLFAITALFGICNAGVRLIANRNPPAWLTMIHGLPAAAGLTLLLYAAFAVGLPLLALIALIFFLVAAAGGALLNLAYQQRGRLLPRAIVYLHALLAVVGFIFLAIALFA